MTAESCPMSQAVWSDALDLGLAGQGWPREELPQPFARLPSRAKELVPPRVWELSLSPAGLYCDVITDSVDLFVRWQLAGDRWTRTGPASEVLVTGLDAYGYDAEHGWAWVGACEPTGDKRDHEARVNRMPLDGRERRYRIYLPISAPLTALAIGVAPSASLRPAPPEPGRSICTYGTSIVHGWTVGRPGMAHPAITARALCRATTALGFAGNARMEPALADLVAEQDPSLFIIDCLPNMSVEQIHERTRPFLERLRNARPETPIILVGDRLFGDHTFQPRRAQTWRDKNRALESVFADCERSGITHIGLIPGRDFFGPDGTVDGSHPNDLGAWRMSRAIQEGIAAYGW